MVTYITARDEGLGINLEPTVFFKLKNKFNVEEVFDTSGFDRIVKFLNITPKDGGKLTNTFFLEVIDFINENLEEPLKQQFIKK